MVSFVDEGVNVSGPIATWISGELRSTCSSAIHLTFHAAFVKQCLSTRENSGDAPSEGHDHVLFHPTSPTPLLREWAKLELTGGSWKDALAAAVDVSIPRSAILRGPDTPLVWSLWPQDLRFIVPSVNDSKRSTR